MKNKIYELTESCVEAANYVVNLDFRIEQTQAIEYVGLIRDAAICILANLEGCEEPATTSELYCKNIIASADKILENFARECQRVEFEIRPFCLELCRLLSLELKMIDVKEYIKNRENSFRDIHRCFSDEFKFKVSIVLVAYNKLEYTKKAVESIYKYTDFEKNQVELITINNGSSDGTEEYFASLPNEKKINLSSNIMGTAVSRHIIDGKFVVGFSNDAVATTNWLDNLLICIESDKNIYMVVPTCNEGSISNGQGTPVPYKNKFDELENMQQFAFQHNHSDWKKWEERSTLMPFVSIFRFTRNEYINTTDALYTQIEFSDDDYATSIRRSGMKLLLAKDTFLHHFGSITLGNAQRSSSSLENMRKVYFKKWGVDAWDSRAAFWGIENMLSGSISGRPCIMVIEPRFAGVFLQIKNYYKKQGIKFDKAIAIGADYRYLDDAKAMFYEVIFRDTVSSALENNREMVDIITSGCYLGELKEDHIIAFLEKLYGKLKPGGMMIFPVINYGSVQIILDMLLQGAIPSYGHEVHEFSGCSFDLLEKKLRKHSFLHQIEMVMVKGNFANMEGVTNRFIDLIDKEIQPLDEAQKNGLRERLNIHSAFLKICKSK